MIGNISILGMCIFQERFMQLPAGMVNTVIDVNKKEGVVLPSNLRKGLFSNTSVDNIDVETKSSSAVTSLHGRAASIYQHISAKSEHQLRILPELDQLTLNWSIYQKWYTEVPPTHLPSVSIPKSKQPVIIVKVSPPELLEVQDWLNDLSTTPCAMFHAKKCMHIIKQPDISCYVTNLEGRLSVTSYH